MLSKRPLSLSTQAKNRLEVLFSTAKGFFGVGSVTYSFAPAIMPVFSNKAYLIPLSIGAGMINSAFKAIDKKDKLTKKQKDQKIKTNQREVMHKDIKSREILESEIDELKKEFVAKLEKYYPDNIASSTEKKRDSKSGAISPIHSKEKKNEVVLDANTLRRINARNAAASKSRKQAKKSSTLKEMQNESNPQKRRELKNKLLALNNVTPKEKIKNVIIDIGESKTLPRTESKNDMTPPIAKSKYKVASETCKVIIESTIVGLSSGSFGYNLFATFYPPAAIPIMVISGVAGCAGGGYVKNLEIKKTNQEEQEEMKDQMTANKHSEKLYKLTITIKNLRQNIKKIEKSFGSTLGEDKIFDKPALPKITESIPVTPQNTRCGYFAKAYSS